MRYQRQGRVYAIEEGLGGGNLKVRDEAAGNCFPVPADELVADLFAGRLEILGEGDELSELKGRLEKSRVADLTMLADDDPLKLEIRRRLRYLAPAFVGDAEALDQGLHRLGRRREGAGPGDEGAR
jgi:hypothetical protein